MASRSYSFENLSAKRETSRLENLTDVVFGLALSVSALSLISSPPHTPAEAQDDILLFMFSFMILILVWTDYSEVMAVLPIETHVALNLNMLMLFLVVLQPYLLYLLHQTGEQLVEFASVIYSLDLGGLMAISGFYHHELSVEEKKLVPQQSLARYRRMRDIHFIYAAWFFLTALPQFWSLEIDDTPIRFYLWLGPLIISWISQAAASMKRHAKPSLR